MLEKLKFSGYLGVFLGDLRDVIFSSVPEAAHAIGIHHSLIYRYEQGKIKKPPIGYAACLAHLIIERFEREGHAVEDEKKILLREVNKAIRACYEDEVSFQTWEELLQSARVYLAERGQRNKGRHTDGELDEDWSQAPDFSDFYGRQEEWDTLERWIVDHHCRLVAVLGLSGIGKTALVTRLGRHSEKIRSHFEYIVWRSLENPRSANEFLIDCLRSLTKQRTSELQKETDDLISLLVAHFKKHACLLILNNLEAVLDTGENYSHFREGYEDYGKLIRKLGEIQHNSCLLLTSREKPEKIAELGGMLEDRQKWHVRPFRLRNLSWEAVREILKEQGIDASEAAYKEFIQRVSGNPLIIKLICPVILRAYQGNVEAYIKDKPALPHEVDEMIEWHFERLPESAKEVLYWLAIEGEPVVRERLKEDLVSPDARQGFAVAINTLRDGSLVKMGGRAFSLEPVIMKYVTKRLVDVICREIQEEDAGFFESRALFQSHALIKAEAKDYVREGQVDAILKRAIGQLREQLGRRAVVGRLQSILSRLQDEGGPIPGYAGGNALNLLLQWKVDLTGWDFSHLAIWEAYLAETRLHDVNFTGADFNRCVFKEPGGVILSVAFSPDRKTLAAALSNCEIQLRRAEDGEHIHTFWGHTDWVTSVIFSHDGNLLASGAGDNMVRFWDVQAGSRHLLPKKHTGPVRAVAFSQDGSTLASGSSDNTIRLWDVEARKYKHILGRHGDHVRYVAFSPAGHNKYILASCGNDKMVKLWDIRSRKCLGSLDHGDNVRSVAFSPDGHLLASGSRDRTVRVWDVENRELLHTLTHQDYVRAVAFSPDGSLLASGGDDQAITLWDVESGERRRGWEAHADRVRTLVFHPDGRILASGSDDCTIRWWNVETGECLNTYYGYYNSTLTIAFGPGDDGHDDLLVSGDEDHTLRLWDVSKGKCIDELKEHRRRVQAVAICHDGSRLASGGDDRLVHVWDWPRREYLRPLEGHQDDVKAVAFNPFGNWLASGSADCTIRIWDVETGWCLRTLEGHRDRVTALAFAADPDTLVSASEDATLRLWNIRTGEPTILGTHGKRIRSVAHSPTQPILASCADDGIIKLWNLASGETRPLPGHTERVRAVAFSPNGQTLVSSSDDCTVRLWDVQSCQCIRILTGHTSFIPDVAFSRDGELVASCDVSGAILIWEQDSGKLLKTLKPVPPYKGMNIARATGLDRAQRIILKALGAVEAR